MQNNPEEILATMWMYSEEEKKAAEDDYWRHIEEEAYYENYYNQFMGAPPRADATASASAYWSEEAQILYARDMAARIIQNNWKKIYNRRNNSNW